MMDCIRRFVRAALGLSLLLLSSLAAAQSALWVAESEGVLKVATAEGQILFEIAEAGGVRNVAVDEATATVWVTTAERLKAYNSRGESIVSTPLPEFDPQNTHPGRLAAGAGRVWLARDKQLWLFDSEGQSLDRIDFRRPVSAMTLDTERGHLWLAVPGWVFVLDADGAEVERFWTIIDAIKQLAYDAALDRTWLVAGPVLLSLAAEDYDVESVSAFGGRLHHRLAPDGAGGVWGATGPRLSHISADGLLEFHFKPFNRPLQDLSADPADQSVWVAGRTRLKHIDANGAELKTVQPDLGDGVIRSISRTALSTAVNRPPELTIAAPADGALLNTARPIVEFEYENDDAIDIDSIALQRAGEPVPAECSGDGQSAQCTPAADLPEGQISLSATVADAAGNVSEPAEVTFTVDTVAPTLELEAPADGAITNQPELTVAGETDEPLDTLTLSLNGATSTLAVENQAFSHAVTLEEGANTIALTAVDPAGNQTTLTRTVTLDTQPPPAPDTGLIAIDGPDEDGQVTVTGQSGSVEPGSTVAITNARTGETVITTADSEGAFSTAIAAEAGDNLQINTTDAAGNTGDSIESQVIDLPSDPADVAPPLDPTGITPFAEATAFLYTGADPIQTGVEPGTIEARRAAVIRGRVLDRDNNPLSGVTVTVKDHPELGQTKTRADGRFDLAVNGGGNLTLNYEKEDYLPVQRKVQTPWRDYAFVDEVVMIQLDPQVTAIEANSAELQVARGTPQTDADGTRQATLLFPAGTTATMTLPGGGTQNLDTLNVRATEYTVGENGPEAMPGKLPPASGYTYAVELSVDEALAAGATRVDFNQPVPFYLDNFLDFPTGEVVPAGWYDRERAAWIASDNGRIVEILAVENNAAVLDVTGDGEQATEAQLNALNITEAELGRLANLYEPGQSLWRTPITHFTPWDCNWPYGPPEDAEPPPEEGPETPDDDEPDDSEDEEECDGCVINPQSQTVGETIPVTGTPFSLHYRSNRNPGHKNNTVTVPISGASVPGSLLGMPAWVTVAGRRLTREPDPQGGVNATFEWDGYDAYGRPVYGSAEATVTVSYIYRCVYYRTIEAFSRAWARVGDIEAEAIGTRRNCRSLVFSRSWTVTLDSPLIPPVNAIGNWSLAPYHSRDESRLYGGDGSRRALRPTIHAFAGTGRSGRTGDGEPAVQARLSRPEGLTVDARGRVYIADAANQHIRRVNSDGTIETIVGSGEAGFAGDGGPATDAQLNLPHGLAAGPTGAVYIADTFNHRIRRVAPDGTITTVAGTGEAGFSGDDGPAVEAQLHTPKGVAVDAAGHLYIADSSNHRIRRIAPDGAIETVAGTSVNGFAGDGGPAVEARLNGPKGVAVDAAGRLHIADTGNARIRRVNTDGSIETIAGTGVSGFGGDGGPATEARVASPNGIAVDAIGAVYIADELNNRIRRIGPGGIINTIAGSGDVGSAGDGGPGRQAELNRPRGVTLDGQGDLFLSDSVSRRVRQLRNAGVADRPVASQDGTRQYRFDAAGRHQQTVNTLTGETEYEFSRDAENRLIAITDADGDVTTIERNNQGTATAIVAPDGQRTELAVNSEGHLEVVTNPAGETYNMAYTGGGLMREFRDRKNQLTEFDYNAQGRLIRDTNPGGGGWTLDRTELENGYETLMTTAEGRELNFTVEPRATGGRIQRNTRADGSVQEKTFRPNGEEVTAFPDGTVQTVREGPDPRFGMQAPVPEETTVETPSGLTSTATMARTAELADPADPLSLESLVETTTINDRVFESAYDATTRTFTDTTPEGRTATRTLNADGRTTSTQITDLAPVDFTYTQQGRLRQIIEGESTEPRVTAFDYHQSGPQAGFLESITDAEDRTVQFEYDAAGRVTTQTLPDDRQIQYDYDANGNLTSIQPPGRPAHVFNYNAFDLEGEYTPPEVDGVTAPQTVYDYNLDEELIRITRPDGQAVDFDYGAATGQLEAMTAGTRNYAYTYLPDSGQLDTVTSPDAIVLDYGYDGFLLTDLAWSGDISGSLDISYNNDFQVSQRCVNASRCIDFDYDDDSLLTGAGALTISRDPQRGGLVTGATLGATATNRTYNDFGELASFEAGSSNTEYFQTQYTRDDLGRITEKTETVEGETVTETYTYDQAGRLETVTRDDETITYEYDSNGNRLSKTVVPAEAGTQSQTATGTYDDQDRLLSYDGCDYSYTDNGELQSKSCADQTTTYEYDALGNLLAVTFEPPLPQGEGGGEGISRIEYLIDGQNRRVGKRVNGELVQGFLYQDQLNPIAELDADGSVKSRFVYGTKPNVPAYMIREGTTYRIVSDHLGSPRLVIDTGTGDIVQRMDYDEFGRVTEDTNPGFQPFGFAGGVYDPDTGLVRFGARDYSAEIGRWTTKDPILFDGGINFYAYSISDPVNLVDLSGLEPEVWDSKVYPPTKNCSFVARCVEKLNEDPSAIDPTDDKKGKDKGTKGKKGLRGMLADQAVKAGKCEFKNYCQCAGTCPDEPPWPPEESEDDCE